MGSGGHNKDNLIGKIFGNLTVVDFSKSSPRGLAQ